MSSLAINDITVRRLKRVAKAKKTSPLHILESVGAKLVDKAYIRGVLGHRQAVKLYMVDLYLTGHKIYAVEVVAVGPDDEIILGRDVLNHLEITLNGPAGVTEIPE